MGLAILLTGPPRCGKTTAVRKIVARLKGDVGGFYTEEILEGGRRAGFRLVTLDGHRGVLAHVDSDSPYRVGRYGVELSALDSLGVESIRQTLESKGVVVIDEIGPMEILSKSFRLAVLEALDHGGLVVGTIVRRSTPVTDSIKSRPDVRVFEVRRETFDVVVDRALAWIRDSGLCEVV